MLVQISVTPKGFPSRLLIHPITGAEPANTGFPGDENGVVVEIAANASYSVDESGGVSGYTKTLDEGCTGNLAPGGRATCTIINDDIAPLLTVVKTVINDDGGIAPSKWSIT